MSEESRQGRRPLTGPLWKRHKIKFHEGMAQLSRLVPPEFFERLSPETQAMARRAVRAGGDAGLFLFVDQAAEELITHDRQLENGMDGDNYQMAWNIVVASLVVARSKGYLENTEKGKRWWPVMLPLVEKSIFLKGQDSKLGAFRIAKEFVNRDPAQGRTYIEDYVDYIKRLESKGLFFDIPPHLEESINVQRAYEGTLTANGNTQEVIITYSRNKLVLGGKTFELCMDTGVLIQRATVPSEVSGVANPPLPASGDDANVPLQKEKQSDPCSLLQPTSLSPSVTPTEMPSSSPSTPSLCASGRIGRSCAWFSSAVRRKLSRLIP